MNITQFLLDNQPFLVSLILIQGSALVILIGGIVFGPGVRG